MTSDVPFAIRLRGLGRDSRLRREVGTRAETLNFGSTCLARCARMGGAGRMQCIGLRMFHATAVDIRVTSDKSDKSVEQRGSHITCICMEVPEGPSMHDACCTHRCPTFWAQGTVTSDLASRRSTDARHQWVPLPCSCQPRHISVCQSLRSPAQIVGRNVRAPEGPDTPTPC